MHCKICGKNEVFVKGLCKSCYYRQRRRAIYGIPPDLPAYQREKTYERNVAIAQAYRAGETQAKIAERYNLSRQRVSQIIKITKSME